MVKVKEIKEKPSKIIKIKEKKLDSSPLEEEIKESSNQQFNDFISTGKANVPIIESGQEQVIPQETKINIKEIELSKPELSEMPQYQPVVLSKLASGSYNNTSRTSKAPVLGRSEVLTGSSDRLGLGKRNTSIHAEQEKYSESKIESEDMKPDRKMPWEY